MMDSMEIIASCDLEFSVYSKLNDQMLILGPDIRTIGPLVLGQHQNLSTRESDVHLGEKVNITFES